MDRTFIEHYQEGFHARRQISRSALGSQDHGVGLWLYGPHLRSIRSPDRSYGIRIGTTQQSLSRDFRHWLRRSHAADLRSDGFCRRRNRRANLQPVRQMGRGDRAGNGVAPADSDRAIPDHPARHRTEFVSAPTRTSDFMPDLATHYLDEAHRQMRGHKRLAEGAMAQLKDHELFLTLDPE